MKKAKALRAFIAAILSSGINFIFAERCLAGKSWCLSALTRQIRENEFSTFKHHAKGNFGFTSLFAAKREADRASPRHIPEEWRDNNWEGFSCR
ncbi:hypothetical protein Ga0100231_015490 [Opitutaceae bacterium TAV4]|uniref:hypothetical protein n=1 Tax=Geminisphaera colitermitum TaxID=1148786 RepID=UPI000FF7CD13|nr:hypothetical protein [Geminisphaera colitermitum]RRJ95489.1 hypothetical protein Ga0100231_015490 [Opitutaceae bacterium TAV4]